MSLEQKVSWEGRGLRGESSYISAFFRVYAGKEPDSLTNEVSFVCFSDEQGEFHLISWPWFGMMPPWPSHCEVRLDWSSFFQGALRMSHKDSNCLCVGVGGLGWGVVSFCYSFLSKGPKNSLYLYREVSEPGAEPINPGIY